MRRAYDLIDAQDRHSLASIAEIQLDVYSYAAATLIPALERVNMRSEKAKSAMRMLTAWDRMMAQDKPEPLLYAAVELAFQQRLVNAHDVSVARRHGDALLLTRILTEGADWCDHPDTEAAESCEDAVNEAVDAAVAAVASEHGNDMARLALGARAYCALLRPLFVGECAGSRYLDRDAPSCARRGGHVESRRRLHHVGAVRQFA